MSTSLVTKKVRLSYVHLTKPYANTPGAEEKYSVTLLIPKTDMETYQAIIAGIQEAMQAGIQSKWNGSAPAQPAIPLYDGDGLRPGGEAFGPECKGHWVLRASSKQRPEVVDINVQPILTPSDIYSGMYGRVSINFFAYANSGKKGIGCGLNNVQKLADGEPLGGSRSSATDDFGQAPVSVTPAQIPPAWPTAPQFAQQPPQPQLPYAQPQFAQQQPPQYTQPAAGFPQQYTPTVTPAPAYAQPAMPQQPTFNQQPQYTQPGVAPQQQAQPQFPPAGYVPGPIMGIGQ